MPTIVVSYNTCVGAAGSAMACLDQGFLSLCAVSPCAHPRDCSCGRMSCPATGSFDWLVFFDSGWLVWVRSWAPWPRSSQIQCLWYGPRTAAGLSVWICGVSLGRSMCSPASRCGYARPMGVRLACWVHALLVSSRASAVYMHGERCRAHPMRTLGMRALCNGRTEFYRPPQSFPDDERL